ncbi:MAG: hypothetical protein ABIO46_14615 [Chitinophagales bacterium]
MEKKKNKQEEEEKIENASTSKDSNEENNKQQKNEVSTSQEKEFDVSTEDLNSNELRVAGENQPNRNAEIEKERFDEELKKK